jgi:hypothetical protein
MTNFLCGIVIFDSQEKGGIVMQQGTKKQWIESKQINTNTRDGGEESASFQAT